jgi:hypothetical protein
METAKGIRNYTPICHSKFSIKKNKQTNKQNRRKDRKQRELSTSEIYDHHDHRDIFFLFIKPSACSITVSNAVVITQFCC